MKSIATTLLAAFLLASYQGEMAGVAGIHINMNFNQDVPAQMTQVEKNVHAQMAQVQKHIQAQRAKAQKDYQAHLDEYNRNVQLANDEYNQKFELSNNEYFRVQAQIAQVQMYDKAQMDEYFQKLDLASNEYNRVQAQIQKDYEARMDEYERKLELADSEYMRVYAQIQKDYEAQMDEYNRNVELAHAGKATNNVKPGADPGSITVIGGDVVKITPLTPRHYESVITGTDSDGQRYRFEIEERIKDGVLHHTVRISNGTTKDYQTYVVERKYSDPQVESIFNNFTTTSQS